MSVARRLSKHMVMVIGAVTVVAVLASCGIGQKISSDASASAPKIAQLETAVASLSDLRAQVVDLKNRQAIRDLIARFFRGIDRHDAQLIDSSFWPDAQANWGGKSFQGKEVSNAIIETDKMWKKNEMFAGSTHNMTNQTVDISGNTAHVETYLMAFFRYGKDKPTVIIGGRYIDRMDRHNEEWRIAVHEFIPSYWVEVRSSFDSELSTWPNFACALGTWDKLDPSYRRPLNPRLEADGAACAEWGRNGRESGQPR